MDKKEQSADKYYQKKFNITLIDYNDRLARQGGVCKGCGRPPGKVRLSVDHDHAYDRLKFKRMKGTTQLYIFVWKGRTYEFWGNLEKAKLYFRYLSIRGLLCMRCNKGLQMFEDSKAPLKPAERLENLAKYLREFESGTTITR